METELEAGPRRKTPERRLVWRRMRLLLGCLIATPSADLLVEELPVDEADCWEPSLDFLPNLTNRLFGEAVGKIGGLGGRECSSSEESFIWFISLPVRVKLFQVIFRSRQTVPVMSISL